MKHQIPATLTRADDGHAVLEVGGLTIHFPGHAVRPPRPVNHGTRRAYNNGCRCGDCKSVNSDYMRARRQSRKAAAA